MSDTVTSQNIDLSSWDTLYNVYTVDIYSTGPYVHYWYSHTLYRMRFSSLTLRKCTVLYWNFMFSFCCVFQEHFPGIKLDLPVHVQSLLPVCPLPRCLSWWYVLSQYSNSRLVDIWSVLLWVRIYSAEGVIVCSGAS